MMSAESSGGVRSSATRTASTMMPTGLRERLADLRVGQREGLGDAVDEIAPLDLHRERLVEGVGRADLDLDLLGGPLADEQVVLALDVLDDRLVHLVAATRTDFE